MPQLALQEIGGLEPVDENRTTLRHVRRTEQAKGMLVFCEESALYEAGAGQQLANFGSATSYSSLSPDLGARRGQFLTMDSRRQQAQLQEHDANIANLAEGPTNGWRARAVQPRRSSSAKHHKLLFVREFQA